MPTEAIPQPDQLSVRYRCSVEDIDAYYCHLLREVEPALRAERRLARRYHYTTLAALPLFVAAGCGIGLLPTFHQYPGWGFCGILGMCAWGLFAAHRATRMFPIGKFCEGVRRAIGLQRRDRPSIECQVSITNDQVRYDIGEDAHVYNWSRVENLAELHGLFAFEFEDLEFVILIPDAAFSTPQAAATFHDRARACHAQSGFDRESRLRKLNSESRPACFNCGYELVGSSATCPECGVQFQVFLMKLLAKYPPHRTFRQSADGGLR